MLVLIQHNSMDLNTTVLHNLTYTLILHPIAGFFGFLALVMGLIGAGAASRVATIFMSIFAFIGAALALIIFVIDMVLWNVLKNRITDAGYNATLVSVVRAFVCLASSSSLRSC